MKNWAGTLLKIYNGVFLDTYTEFSLNLRITYVKSSFVIELQNY